MSMWSVKGSKHRKKQNVGRIPESITPHKPFGRYLGSLLLVLLMTLLGFPLSTFLAPTNLVMLYLVAVVLSAVFLGQRPIDPGIDRQRAGFRFLFYRSSLHLYRQ